MNVAQMRWVDSYLGGAVCALLSLFHKLTGLPRRRVPPAGEIRRVLVMKFLGMGSILLATPLVRELRRSLPGARCALLTFEGNADFARRLGLFDEVVVIRTGSAGRFVRDVLAVLARNARQRYDVVLDLEFFARFSTIISYLSLAPMRVGYYLPKLWRGDLITHPVHFNPYRHVTEVFAALLGPLGIPVGDLTPATPAIREQETARVRALLTERGVAGADPLITVNVNASELSRERRWSGPRFAGLIEHLACTRPEAWIALVGAKGEAAYVGEVLAGVPPERRGRVLDLSGRLGIGELMALLAMSELFVTSDSGPLHIASALRVPTLSFFGPETPSLYGPVGAANVVLYAGIYCSPCLNVYNAKHAMCRGNNVCMQALDLEGAVAALEKLRALAAGRPGAGRGEG